jgi:hypothetical protein
LKIRIVSPFGFQRNPPEGAKNRRKAPLSAKTGFSLDEAPELGENLKLPGFLFSQPTRPEYQPRFRAGFLLSGVFFLQKGCGLQANESPVTSEPAGKTESGEAIVFTDKVLAHVRRRSAAPRAYRLNILLLTTREKRYK